MAEQPLAQFEPYLSGVLATSGLALIVAGLSAVILLLLVLNAGMLNRNYRLLFTMLVFFTLLISSGIGLFNYLTGERTGPVRLFADRLETPYGTFSMDEIRDIQLYIDQDRSPLSQQLVTSTHYRLLLIMQSGKTYSFSDSSYDPEEMIGIIRPAWEKALMEK